ncbi:hypothetical protein ABEB36_013366 [Hypothenemus hampei]|uniref:Uncharacterized protein n=1 Tax=Hypothenemus hampei TaxID=57062 RepID=A0ABD1E7S2_HYPHA
MGLLNATVTAIMIVGLASSSPQHLDKLLEPGNLVTHSEQVLDIADEWTKFKRLFLKSFSPEENIKRFNIFQENWKRIDVLKKQFQNGELDFEVGITQFADLTKEEFIEKHLTLKVPHGKFKRGLSTRSNRTVRHVPEFLDWRTRGAITPVKQQGQCASCWAFSVVGSLETQHFLKHGTLVSLSEQNLIDCSVDEVNSGCSGGWMANAFNYLKSHSISSEKYYPYKGVQETCVSKRTFQVSIQDFHQLAADEMILLESVASVEFFEITNVFLIGSIMESL